MDCRSGGSDRGPWILIIAGMVERITQDIYCHWTAGALSREYASPLRGAYRFTGAAAVRG